MKHSETINELSAALSKAQGQIKGALKDSKNPFFKSSYADLASVWDACRDPLSSNGLCVIQSPEETQLGVMIETMLCHSSGQWISSKYVMPVGKGDAQAVGSAITYGRRYALAAMIGIAPEEDDGNAASAQPAKKQPVKKQPEKEAESKPLELMPDEKFSANIPTYKGLIVSGKYNSETLIKFLNTKAILTEDQVQAIKEWEVEDKNGDVPQ